MDVLNSARSLLRAVNRARVSSQHVPITSRPAQRSLHLRCNSTPPSPLRKRISSTSNNLITNQVRRESTAASSPPRPLTDRSDASGKDESAEARKAEEPSYELTFTCKKCTERSSHRMTKQAYHGGTVLITCPGCKNRHLIADHLKVFSDTSVTIEDIMKEKGQFLKKGRLGADGDVEFYDDSKKGV